MSVTIEGNQGLGQLVSLMEFGFLKVHQRLLRQEILLSEINTNANEDAKLASLRHNDLLNILKVVYKDTHDHVSRPYMTASYEVDFDEHIRGNLTGWTFHFSPLCFKIR